MTILCNLAGTITAYKPTYGQKLCVIAFKTPTCELVVEQSELILAADQQPFEGHYPFSRWASGEVVTDARWVALPSDLPPGTYQIRIGVYNTLTGTGERRRIQDPLNDAAGDSLMLDTFEIP
ncbi:MAG: hypothetical protein ACUVRU_00650 [Anaerolineae bacterium]